MSDVAIVSRYHVADKDRDQDWDQDRDIPSRSEFWNTYAFKERIGTGQFGEVWRCVERATGHNFACKEVEVRSPSHWRRVKKEIECMRALAGRDRLVQLHEVHREGDSVYLVMELCNAGDLFEAISASASGLPEDASRDIFRCVARGLAQCHAEGFLHRDIKPENVLLHSDGGMAGEETHCRHPTAKLADFGLAEQVDPIKGTVRGKCGSAQYAAPEVVRGQAYSFPADVWSLGMLLFTMLQASWPELDSSRAVVVNSNWSSLSFEAQDLIARMLMPLPENRPTLDEVLLHPWLRNTSSSPTAQ